MRFALRLSNRPFTSRSSPVYRNVTIVGHALRKESESRDDVVCDWAIYGSIGQKQSAK